MSEEFDWWPKKKVKAETDIFMWVGDTVICEMSQGEIGAYSFGFKERPPGAGRWECIIVFSGLIERTDKSPNGTYGTRYKLKAGPIDKVNFNVRMSR